MTPPQNSGKIVQEDRRKTSATVFHPGHPKLGGKKKGYKSSKDVTRELLMRNYPKRRDGKIITFQEAMLYSLIDQAMEGDLSALKFIFQQARDLIVSDEKKHK